MVTDNGSPSGIATTTTIMPIIKKFKIATRSFPVCHSLEIPF